MLWTTDLSLSHSHRIISPEARVYSVYMPGGTRLSKESQTLPITLRWLTEPRAAVSTLNSQLGQNPSV